MKNSKNEEIIQYFEKHKIKCEINTNGYYLYLTPIETVDEVNSNMLWYFKKELKSNTSYSNDQLRLSKIPYYYLLDIRQSSIDEIENGKKWYVFYIAFIILLILVNRIVAYLLTLIF